MLYIVKKLYQKSRTDYWMTIAVSILTVLLYLQIPVNLHFLFLLLIRPGLNYPLTAQKKSAETLEKDIEALTEQIKRFQKERHEAIASRMLRPQSRLRCGPPAR